MRRGFLATHHLTSVLVCRLSDRLTIEPKIVERLFQMKYRLVLVMESLTVDVFIISSSVSIEYLSLVTIGNDFGSSELPTHTLDMFGRSRHRLSDRYPDVRGGF